MLAPQPDFSWIDPDFADVATQAGQFVPSLIGAGLMVLAIGLSHRVNLAWSATIVLLLAGAAFTAAQGEQLWIAGVLVLAALLLAPFRACFYRHARLLSGPLEAVHRGAAADAGGLRAGAGRVRAACALAAEQCWWEVVLSPEVPNSLRAAASR